ncbi:MAG: hypothetical protein WC467_02460 [Patescibacteria group bacterium]
MKNIENKMKEKSSEIYWQINEICDNLLYMAKELPRLSLAPKALMEINAIIGEYFRGIDFIRSQALEVCEEFALFIFDPGVTRYKVANEHIGIRLGRITGVLSDQSSHLNAFITSMVSRPEEINGAAPVLFYESGGNMLRNKKNIINAANFIINHLSEYEYEIKSKNTKSS